MAEVIRIKSKRNLLNSAISEILAVRKLIENRDVGDIVALPIEDFVKAQPQTIKLTITYYSSKEPPFRAGFGDKRVILNIPDVKRTSLDWNTIKQAAGGSNGYMWGRFRCTANLSNGRQMAVYGATEQEAEQRLKALKELSDASIVTLSITEEKKEGKRANNATLHKESTRIYPAFFSVINNEKIQVESKRELEAIKYHKINKLDGTFIRERSKKIPLWVEKEPSTAKEIIREALRVRGIG